jgi:hypothetical protein
MRFSRFAYLSSYFVNYPNSFFDYNSCEILDSVIYQSITRNTRMLYASLNSRILIKDATWTQILLSNKGLIQNLSIILYISSKKTSNEDKKYLTHTRSHTKKPLNKFRGKNSHTRSHTFDSMIDDWRRCRWSERNVHEFYFRIDKFQILLLHFNYSSTFVLGFFKKNIKIDKNYKDR